MPRIGGSVVAGTSGSSSAATSNSNSGGGPNMSHYNMLLNNMTSATTGMTTATAGMTSTSGGSFPGKKAMSTRETNDLDSTTLAELLNGNRFGSSEGEQGPSIFTVPQSTDTRGNAVVRDTDSRIDQQLKSFYSKKQPNSPPKLLAPDAGLRNPVVKSRTKR